jgi:hypothetical protein
MGFGTVTAFVLKWLNKLAGEDHLRPKLQLLLTYIKITYAFLSSDTSFEE